MDQPRCFFAPVKTLPDINIDYPKDTGEFVFARYLNNPIMTPTRGLLICFSCIFLLMLLLHKSTKFNSVKKSPKPRKNSVKDENHQDNTLTELEIDFTNISVLREVMIKG